MKYVVVKIGGSQYKVSEGDELVVEKLEGKKDEILEFNQVLLYVNDDKLKIGQPFIKGAKVKAKVVNQLKGEKLRVATYKAKARYRRVKGHRKHLTQLKITQISLSASKKKTS